ncbi:hypothetical protein BDW68DRAFT_160014 [Aspergillus falconensis]
MSPLGLNTEVRRRSLELEPGDYWSGVGRIRLDRPQPPDLFSAPPFVLDFSCPRTLSHRHQLLVCLSLLVSACFFLTTVNYAMDRKTS